jgi:hypothetical protein
MKREQLRAGNSTGTHTPRGCFLLPPRQSPSPRERHHGSNEGAAAASASGLRCNNRHAPAVASSCPRIGASYLRYPEPRTKPPRSYAHKTCALNAIPPLPEQSDQTEIAPNPNPELGPWCRHNLELTECVNAHGTRKWKQANEKRQANENKASKRKEGVELLNY